MRKIGRFSNGWYSDMEAASNERLVELAEDMYEELSRVLVPSRETSLAMTKLEEAMMWANKSISMNGVVQ